MTRNRVDRREFLQWSAAAGAVMAGYHVNPLAAQQTNSPNERLNIAAVGVTGRAAEDIRGCASQNIVAIADVDSGLLEKGGKLYPQAKRYTDFRDMLDKEAQNIDAVVVGTPDHTHAVAAAMALRLKKHVYCEKPLTHTVLEARTLAQLAKENNLVTQMGNQIHAGDNYRRVVELIEAGAIGQIGEVHVWSNATYTGAVFTPNTPKPEQLNWDLWLGPTPERPYSEGIHPFYWRRFWDYGNGALGDFGCHYMDLVHWALKLRNPLRVSARGPEVDPVSAPAWLICDFEYPARENLPPVKLTWYDSGKQPELLATLRTQNATLGEWNSGQLFIGANGMIISDYSRHMLLPTDKFADFKRPDATIPASIGHHEEWLHAIKTKGTTTCNFDYAGALTETVLLGVVSYRSGKAIEWDSENLKVTNASEAQQFVHREYRKGWKL